MCLAAQGQYLTLACAGHFKVTPGIAGMIGRQQVLATVLDPLDRTPERAGGKGNEEIFGVELAACAEPASDIAFFHVDGIDGNAHLSGKHASIGMRYLAGTQHGETSFVGGPRPDREQSARLHGHGRMALDSETFAPQIGRAGEDRTGVTLDRAEGERVVAVGALE